MKIQDGGWICTETLPTHMLPSIARGGVLPSRPIGTIHLSTLDSCVTECYYAALRPKRPHKALHPVCPSVRLSVRAAPTIYSKSKSR